MTRAAPHLLGRDRDAGADVRGLWASAARIDAAIADPERLRRLLGPAGAAGPRPVRLVSARALDAAPPEWDHACLDGDPTPEFVLFYRAGCDFPDCALIFSGGPAGETWWTWHQRPLVLQRLRERFDDLRAAARGELAIAAGSPARVLEAPRGGSFMGRPWTTPGLRWEIREAYDRDGGHRTGRDALEDVSGKELYRCVLAAHFADLEDADAGERPESAPALAMHQRRAYERALEILERFGGVIVADAVGLGKTYVGVRLLERTVAEGGRGLVIAPAALREQWAGELAYLGVAAAGRGGNAPRTERASDADASDNLDFWLEEAAPVTLISMESLGRLGFDRAAQRGADIVVVDEAHNFRNPATRRYRALLDLARHARLVLLTATPVNNSLRDLQHLVDLFAAPGAFRHLGVSDYREAFRAAADGRGDVDRIVSACLVRRTRRCLRAAYGGLSIPHPAGAGELRFPRRAPPRAVEYGLGETYGDMFAGIEGWLDELAFPTVIPEGNGAGPRGTDAAALLKIILLKRLESSVDAFRGSVVGQLAWCTTALRAIDAGRVLTRPAYRSGFRGSSDDPGGQLALFELMLPAPALDDAAIRELRGSLEDDLDLLAHIHGALAAIGPRGDLKLRRLLELLDGPLAGRKVLLFTEFRDTARYLHHQLRDRPRVAEIDSGGARLGLDRVPRHEVIERFAPRSNGLPEPHERERVDLLIATDVLSEGLNLQDASVVVSYDLPWNPVRLMQRVGRIDRLGALAEVVELHHFVPARGLDRLLRLMARLQEKLAAIESAIGLDHPVLAAIDAPSGDGLDRIRRLAVDPDEYGRMEEELEGPLDPEEQAYLDRVALLDRAELESQGSRARPALAAVTADELAAVSYWRLSLDGVSRGLWLICDPATGYVVEDQVGALRALRRALDAPARRPDERVVAAARRSCARYARSLAARLQAARIAGDALRPGLPQSRIAAWLSRYYESAADRLPAAERERIDGLLDRMSRRLSLAGERALARVAESLPDRTTPKAVKKLAEAVDDLAAAEDGGIAVVEVALLLLAPSA